jgi:hypothetical protein
MLQVQVVVLQVLEELEEEELVLKVVVVVGFWVY